MVPRSVSMQSGSELYKLSAQKKTRTSWHQLASQRRGFLTRPVIMGFCLLGLTLMIGCEKKEEKPKAMPPEVQVIEAMQQDVPSYGEWVAQLNGPINAEVTPKVQGYLLK